MRRTIIILSTIFAAILLFSGCAQLEGNSPEGVTGGTDNGYGSFGSNYCDSLNYAIILGSWQHGQEQGGYEVVTFSADNNIKVDFFSANGGLQYSETGSYAISGNHLDINVQGSGINSGTYKVEGNKLTLTGDDNSTEYQRIK